MSNGRKLKMRTDAEDALYVNRFIVMYTLRCLWKSNKNRVPDLHKILFEAVKNGRTPYDNLLQENGYCRESDAKRFENITGLSQDYFKGEHTLTVPGLTKETWVDFIWRRSMLRGGSTNVKKECRELEDKINTQIKRANSMDERMQNEPFRRLAYFAKYKCKKTAKAAEDGIAEVEKLICSFQRQELEQVDVEKLERYRNCLKEHFERITAICILQKWKKIT